MIYGKNCALIGAVHLQPLPGAAGYGGSIENIFEEGLFGAQLY